MAVLPWNRSFEACGLQFVFLHDKKQPCKLSMLRIAGTCVTLLYVWMVLPLGWLGFTHRCSTWPLCGRLGVSMSTCLKSPQATGAMAGAFMYPCLHSWFNITQYPPGTRSISIKASLVILQVAVGVFLSCPESAYPLMSITAFTVFSLTAVFHCWLMLPACAQSRKCICKVLLIIAVCASIVHTAVALFGQLIFGPYLAFTAECVICSCFACYVLVWYHGGFVTETVRLSSILRFMGTAVPVAYIWSLPFLGRVGFGSGVDGVLPQEPKTLSDSICTPQATGAMAAVFFYPCLHAWENLRQLRVNDLQVKASLIGFQVCFGFFLACPVTKAFFLHLFFVAVFGCFGLWYCYLMRKYCRAERKMFLDLTFGMAATAFVLIGLGWLLDELRLWEKVAPQLPPAVFLCECVGLTSMVLYATIWQIDQKQD